MGKVKRLRKKLHTAAVKVKDRSDADKNVELDMEMELKPKEDGGQGKTLDNKGQGHQNLFSGIDINVSKLTQRLPDFDARSAITSKSLKGLNMKKKEKQRLKHQIWKNKVSALDTAKEEAKEKKRKSATPVVGDIGLLGDALPTLELLLKGSNPKKGEQEDTKKNSIAKQNKRHKQMLQDMSIFNQVLDHPAYQENPGKTLLEHLQNKLKAEDMDT